MNTDILEALLSTKRDHPAIAVVRTAAMPLYPLILLGIKLSLAAKARASKSLPRPVISVGNITAGGTGKTSFVRLLLELVERKGLKTAVLSKGYKRTTRGLVEVGRTGGTISGYSVCGDEPYMMANWRTGASIFIHDDLYEAGLAAVRRDCPDVFILDDGFQHVRLKRDLDVVLLDATNPFDNGRLLPFGLLREPMSALRRSSLIVLTRCNQSDLVDATQRIVEDAAPGIPVIKAVHQADSIHSSDGHLFDLAKLGNKSVYVFSGIGNPFSFYITVLECGARIKGARVFPDHHPYSSDDLLKLEEEARRSGADWLLTTEKDMVRIARASLSIPLCALAVKLRIISGMKELESAVENVLNPNAFRCRIGGAE
jgi:tetraacyldisaccharide 4'-kinase